MKLRYKIVLVFLFFSIFIVKSANLNAAEPLPVELEGIGVDEKLGNQIDLQTTFRDETGKEVKLQDYFDGKHPVILTLVYYGCPNLCGFLLNGFVDSLKTLAWSPGKEFNIVTVSIDPSEKSDLAAQKKESILGAYKRDAANSWHFLTGDEPSIQKLASQVGFKYRYDKDEKQYAHSAVIFLISPEGKVTRYLYGIQFPERDLKLGLMEASKGKIGTVVDKFLMFCYHYDPKGKKYAIMAMNVMKLGAIVTVLLIGIVVLFQLRLKKN